MNELNDEIKNILGGISAKLSDIERIHEDNLIKQYDESKSMSNFIKKMDRRISAMLWIIFSMGGVLITASVISLYIQIEAFKGVFKF